MNKIWIIALLLVSIIIACSEQKQVANEVNDENPVDITTIYTQAPLNPTEVCMVNNTHMGKAQIPVEYEGKTYYGCCQMCVKKIQTDSQVRYAVDPQSGKQVDKAKAFIVTKPGSTTGEVIYFESVDTYQQYKKS
jgi:YHS domain-containing protein